MSAKALRDRRGGDVIRGLGLTWEAARERSKWPGRVWGARADGGGGSLASFIHSSCVSETWGVEVGGVGSCCVIPYTRRPEFNFSKRIRVLRTLQGPYCHVARP